MFTVPKPFSKDLRERVVAAYNSGAGTIQKVAELFNLGKSTVEKYLSIHRSTGDLTPGKSTGRPTVLDEKHLSILKEIILSAPDQRLQDYCISFEKKTGMNIPKSTLWDACQLLNIHRKKRVFTPKNKKEKM
jgi:transposase